MPTLLRSTRPPASGSPTPGKGLRIDRAANTVQLSKIFDWLADDFAAAGGVLAFVTRYAPERERSWLSAHGPSARLEYFDYDWALNALPNKVE